MTFREKIKSILHHSGNKKSIPNANASPATPSPTPAAAPTAAKPDPNKPPNARDPGFRKSFNLGDPPTTNGFAKTEPRPIGSPNSQNVPVNGNSRSHMYTVDKYGDDYLAVSPRTNVTVPEGIAANRGLASCSSLDADETAKASLGTVQEKKPNDAVVGAVKALDGLSSPQQNPNFGREQFAHGERKDSGFVEPVPTRDTTVSPNPKPEHPATFALESSPPTAIVPEPQVIVATNPNPATSSDIGPTTSSPETKYSSLLTPPHAVEDGASSVYSDDSTRPTLQQIASSDYGPLVESPDLKAASPAPATTSATEHQKRYSLLVSEELPVVEEAKPQANGVPAEEKEPLPAIDEKTDLLTVVRRSFGESSAAGEISPSILPADETNTWSRDLIANIDKIQSGRDEQEKKKVVVNGIANGANGDTIPDTAVLGNPAVSIDAQAAAFADIVMAHVDSVKSRNQEPKDPNAHPLPVLLPPDQKPIVTTTNTVPHADAYHMGDDVPDVPVIEGKSPIVTTTNTVPHVKVMPTGASGGDDELPRLSFNGSIYANRDKVQYDSALLGLKDRPVGDEDSVYAVTKEIPGAF
ncbi:hypothetical protein TWF281_011572 [Arthrobotrys megalospora]